MRVLSIALVLALAGSGAALQDCSDDEYTEAHAATSQLQLRDDMRELGTAHVTWTRVSIVDAVAGLPDTPQATQRLLLNQTDIGNAVRPYYGDAAADRLTALLREHITGAAEVVAAARANDAPRLATANAAWRANANEVADFLASANPHWSRDDLRSMMRTHLDQTVAEATARLRGDWAADVVAYDAVVKHILHMADALSAGISAQFLSR